MKIMISLLLSLITGISLSAQTGTVIGTISDADGPLPYATVYITALERGTSTDINGAYQISDVPVGSYEMTISSIGYDPTTMAIQVTDGATLQIDAALTTERLSIDEIVVTGTKTFKRKTNSPIIVGVLSDETLGDIQACALSDGLKFQPGLRVETDCQTCNYTQLRINGLAGGYSQILINGRPIFSPLTGLYGMEQLPTSMIDRIEVVRGGGSSLYGSSAIGGTVNVITKIPKKNGYEIGYTCERINDQTTDQILSGNATILSKSKKLGTSVFFNRRRRGLYDHNDDAFSELPELDNTSLGANLYYQPTENQKLELSLSNLNEYRYGGQYIDDETPTHLAEQAEERTHHVWMGSLDYQYNFDDENTSLITYAAWQNTDREHYTGIIPDEGTPERERHLSTPPYGTSDVTTYNVGVQLNHRVTDFLGGDNVMTIGTEYVYDDVLDEIPAYRYLVDQTTRDWGAFVQSDWAVTPQLTLLSGVRMDRHNLVDDLVWSPRASLLYKPLYRLQLRGSYGAGFRAPQAFDADLHIAFAGGGISRVSLSPDLQPERSDSWSISANYDHATEHYIAGFTIEGFRTRLDRAFYLQPVGEDEFGERFEKRNGQGATVQGATLELRANYDKKVQLEAGMTLQTSRFDTEVKYISEVPGLRDFIRTPGDYGYAILSIMPSDRLTANVNYIYTGSMQVPHFAGAPNQTVDEIITSRRFSEVSAKVSYRLPLPSLSSQLEIYGGVRNAFNAYQSTFDIGKNRDSNFVYGPSQPRTWYVGMKWRG